MDLPSYWLVMPAAGRGRRMGEGERLPKQYQPLAGRTVLEHALAPFLADPACRGVVVALAAGDRHFAALPLARDPRVATVTGGAERRDSVAAGLATLRARLGAEDPWVLVHDAARPCLPRADLARLLAALPGAPDGALLALRIADTVKRAGADGRVERTVPREALHRAQTPQAFRLGALSAALAADPAATDEASALEAAGARPLLVAGSATNIKVTEPGDLELAGRLLGEARMGESRIGFGIDVHAFGPGDHVMLGGERVPYGRGVVAHSDGDVLLHALCDALLGAAGLGDIGQHFPDSDPAFRGVASVELLRATLARIGAAGLAVVNADLTLLGEAPRIAPHRERIRTAIARELGLPPERVNLKATTTERLGFLGRGEGLAAEAAVLLETRA
ncbi:MAG TPA: 2-C-methyl-D-erythritol 4-phosphate cytidylyltransferase [Steroidobacteraceae bacterium]|nr:2-C-methyl-D-erythritol 4-phosphate cytidylyltransferase [Steroidobacteraceae bacterium]